MSSGRVGRLLVGPLFLSAMSRGHGTHPHQDPVRSPCLYQYYYLLKILYLVCLNARL
jgi:hypothetical protein